MLFPCKRLTGFKFFIVPMFSTFFASKEPIEIHCISASGILTFRQTTTRIYFKYIGFITFDNQINCSKVKTYSFYCITGFLTPYRYIFTPRNYLPFLIGYSMTPPKSLWILWLSFVADKQLSLIHISEPTRQAEI